MAATAAATVDAGAIDAGEGRSAGRIATEWAATTIAIIIAADGSAAEDATTVAQSFQEYASAEALAVAVAITVTVTVTVADDSTWLGHFAEP